MEKAKLRRTWTESRVDTVEPWRKEGKDRGGVGMEGWREEEEEPCCACDGWAFAPLWRRKQIKSASRQQWTRDKVITFTRLLPSSLCLLTPQWSVLTLPGIMVIHDMVMKHDLLFWFYRDTGYLFICVYIYIYILVWYYRVTNYLFIYLYV